MKFESPQNTEASNESENTHERDIFAVQEILNLNDEQLQKFQERVEVNNGQVDMVMHPFFGYHHNKELSPVVPAQATKEAKISRQQQYVEEGFQQMLLASLNQPDKAPLLVFEEADFLIDSLKRIKTVTNLTPEQLTNAGIYIIATQYDKGLLTHEQSLKIFDTLSGKPPILPHLEKLQAIKREAYAMARNGSVEASNTTETLEEYREAFRTYLETSGVERVLGEVEKKLNYLDKISTEVLTSFLRGLEIQSVTLAGGYFRREKGDRRKGDTSLMPDGCAGYLRHHMRKIGIQVDLSEYVMPPKKSIEKMEKEQ